MQAKGAIVAFTFAAAHASAGPAAVTAIYWQAVQLIRKGVPRQPQATGPDVEVTYATAGSASEQWNLRNLWNRSGDR